MLAPKAQLPCFKGFKPNIKRQFVQTFWAYTMEVGIGIHTRDLGNFKQWRDLSRQSMFTGPMPWDVRAALERGMEAIGVNHQYMQVDLSTMGSLVDAGRLKGFIACTSAEATPAPWIVALSLATDWAILNPSEEEMQMLRDQVIEPVQVSKDVFKKDVKVDSVTSLPFFYGFHVGLEVPEEDIYRMLVAIENNSDDLVKAGTGVLLTVRRPCPPIARTMIRPRPGNHRGGVFATIDNSQKWQPPAP